MKKKFIIITVLLIIILFGFFMYEKGIYYFIKPKITSTLLIDDSYSSYGRDREYHGLLIYDNGIIYIYQDDVNHIVGRKWYKVRTSDLRRLRKYINELDGEFEIEGNSSTDKDGNTIYVYKNQEKVKIYEYGDVNGKNNSDACDKILKIIHKYL